MSWRVTRSHAPTPAAAAAPPAPPRAADTRSRRAGRRNSDSGRARASSVPAAAATAPASSAATPTLPIRPEWQTATVVDSSPSLEVSRAWVPSVWMVQKEKLTQLGCSFLTDRPFGTRLRRTAPSALGGGLPSFYQASAQASDIDRGVSGVGAAQFRARLAKSVVAECVVRLALSAGLLKASGGCVFLPTEAEIQTRAGGHQRSAASAAPPTPLP
ncbi:unnamed protein product, partial [Pylaiella littoralis]